MFKVKVSGTYVLSGKISEIDYYEAEFELNEGREAYARAIIQNDGMLDRFLEKSKEYPKYKRWRTCQIESIDEIEGKVGTDNAEVETLIVEATELGCIPANFKSFKKPMSKIKVLSEAIKKKKERIERSKKTVKGMKEEAA